MRAHVCLAVLTLALVAVGAKIDFANWRDYVDIRENIVLPGSETAAIKETQFAGFINVDPEINGKLFFWAFEARNNPETAPLVLWMTGGPGCSSELAVVFENGPFRVNDNLTLSSNPYSWNELATVVYIDQPFGVGFSPPVRTGNPTDEAEVADIVYTFLQLFLSAYPAYANVPLFVTGESYGGHYVPAVAARIVQGGGSGPTVGLAGMAIGNPLLDPYVQFAAYGPFAELNGLVTSSQAEHIAHMADDCQALLSKGLTTLAFPLCESILEVVVKDAPRSINVYNIDLPCVVPGLCYNFTTQTEYLNLPSVQAALGVDSVWTTCVSTSISDADELASFDDDVATVLAAGIDVIIYDGMLDLICNWIGVEAAVTAIQWPGAAVFAAAPQMPFTNGTGVQAGWYRTANASAVLAALARDAGASSGWSSATASSSGASSTPASASSASGASSAPVTGASTTSASSRGSASSSTSASNSGSSTQYSGGMSSPYSSSTTSHGASSSAGTTTAASAYSGGAGGAAVPRAAVEQGTLTFAAVFSAGHMVPHDAPASALAILQALIDHTVPQ